MFKIRGKIYIFITVLVLSFSVVLQITQPTNALSGNQFKAGNIISDSIFYRKSSLSVSEIQKFLNSKVPSCDTYGTKPHSSGGTRADYGRANGAPPPYRCLKSHKMSTQKKSATSGLCSSMSAKTGQTAAQIIYSVSRACGVDSKVLLVMLQKEQALVTDDWPWPTQYRIAMGYGCPDTAPCNSQYYGFFNQVYNASRQLKRYVKDAHLFNYRAGRTNYIQYNPNSSCGGKNVFIENSATAALYNYTPYAPNAATLAVGLGQEAPCGAYGNKNFWWYYNIWFGSTHRTKNYILIECDNQQYMVERFRKLKRPLTNDATRAWNFEDNDFIAGAGRCNYPTYSLPLGQTVRSRTTKKIYVTDSYKHWYMQSASIGRAWGLSEKWNDYSQIPQLDGSTLNYLQIERKTPRLVVSANTDKVYLLDRGILHHIYGTGAGSPDSESLSLIRGYDIVPIATFSGELLSDIKSENGAIDDSINAGFSVGSKRYTFDHGKIRWIKPSYYPGRWEDINELNGPELHPDILGVSVQAESLGPGFKRDGYYYFVGANGEIITSTSVAQARLWGVNVAPVITHLLRSKLL